MEMEIQKLLSKRSGLKKGSVSFFLVFVITK
jgi:hypothetical protein